MFLVCVCVSCMHMQKPAEVRSGKSPGAGGTEGYMDKPIASSSAVSAFNHWIIFPSPKSNYCNGLGTLYRTNPLTLPYWKAVSISLDIVCKGTKLWYVKQSDKPHTSALMVLVPASFPLRQVCRIAASGNSCMHPVVAGLLLVQGWVSEYLDQRTWAQILAFPLINSEILSK